MARRDLEQEQWRREKEERVRRESEEKYRKRIARPAEPSPVCAPPREADLGRLLAEVQSPDEAARARAVRSLCPCRIGWEGFQEGMEAAARLRKDPSAEVRKHALHVFEDAFGMQSMESHKAEREARESETDANDLARRQRQEERRRKKEAARSFGRRG